MIEDIFFEKQFIINNEKYIFIIENDNLHKIIHSKIQNEFNESICYIKEIELDHISKTILIWGLFTIEKYRNLKMATFILNNLYDFLKQNYINYDLELYCLEINEVGLKLYRNLQFKEGKDLYSNRTKSIKFTKKII